MSLKIKCDKKYRTVQVYRKRCYVLKPKCLLQFDLFQKEDNQPTNQQTNQQTN